MPKAANAVPPCPLQTLTQVKGRVLNTSVYRQRREIRMQPTYIIGGIVLDRTTIDRIVDLRQLVLGVGQMPEDNHRDTRHFGAFHEADEKRQNPVSCVSYMRERYGNLEAWRLNGLATHPSERGKRIAFYMLPLTERLMIAEDESVKSFWCYAREAACSTYVKDGWEFASGLFVRKGRSYFIMTKRC